MFQYFLPTLAQPSLNRYVKLRKRRGGVNHRKWPILTDGSLKCNFLKKKRTDVIRKLFSECIPFGGPVYIKPYQYVVCEVWIIADCRGLENYHFSFISCCYFLLNLKFILNIFAIDKSEVIHLNPSFHSFTIGQFLFLQTISFHHLHFSKMFYFTNEQYYLCLN